MADTWYVYILECQDGSLYTGVTKSPARRLAEHQAGGCRYTRSRRGLRMLRIRRCMNKVRAYQYEWALKQLTRKEKLSWCEGRIHGVSRKPVRPALAANRQKEEQCR